MCTPLQFYPTLLDGGAVMAMAPCEGAVKQLLTGTFCFKPKLIPEGGNVWASVTLNNY